MAINNEQLCCPQCGDKDQVHRVRVIYRDSISTGTQTGWITTYGSGGSERHYANNRVTVQTQLGKFFTPPTEPAPPTIPGSASRLNQFFVEGLLLLLVGSILIAILNRVLPSGDYPLLLDIALLALLVILIHPFFEKARNRAQEVGRREMQKWQEITYPNWQKSQQRWEQLLYCYRCDVTFYPGKANFVPPDKIDELYNDTES